MLRALSLSFALVLAAAPTAEAKSEVSPGNYIVYFAFNSAGEQGLVLIKVQHKGGKDVAEILDGPEGAALDSFDVDGKKVAFILNVYGRKLAFDGTLSAKDPKEIFGTLGDDKLIARSKLAPTDKEKIADSDRFKATPPPDSMAKAQKLTSQLGRLRFQLRQSKDDSERGEIKKKIEAAQKEIDEQAPALYKEVIEKHADSPAVVDAVLGLIAYAAKSAKPADAAQWLKAVEAFAQPYGPRYQTEVLEKCAEGLVAQKGFEQLGLELAERLAGNIADSTSAEQKVRLLTVLHRAQEKAGQIEMARRTATRLAALEADLDKAYLAKVPPFKPKTYQGRKVAESDRVAVVELFTGAQCPPCVAADVAFDALQKAYKPSELILLQYHMHIPGPDPMTNPDSEARWKYYQSLRGTPSTLFNGKVGAPGGGGMAQAEDKFAAFKKVIDPLLDESAAIKLSGNVSAKGDTVAVKIDVKGIKEGADKLKLRLALVEESIKYVGGNGLRFHHQVVRAFPGGVDGLALKEKSETKSVEINLADLRKSLAKYLDEEEKEKTFPNANRPLALKHLRMVAFVQDDATKEIVQAIQFDVPATD